MDKKYEKIQELLFELQVEDVMIKDPKTVSPNDSILKAVRIMQEDKLGCLPVIFEGALVGSLTESDFLSIAARLIEQSSDE